MPGSARRRTPGSNGAVSQLLQNTPLHPIAEWGRQRFGGADVPAGAAARRPGKLAGAGQARPGGKCAPARAAARHSAAAGPRAELGAGGIAPPAIGGADQLGDGGRRSQPVVLAFEDLHWADPTTLDVLRGIAERGALAPLLVVATTRPEFRAALEHALASRHHLACAARSRAGARHGGRAFRAPRAVARGGSRTSPSAPAACRCSSRR